MVVYLDTSALFSWVRKDDRFAHLDAWIAANEARLAISDFGRLELASAHASTARAGNLAPREVPTIMSALDRQIAGNIVLVIEQNAVDIAAAVTMVGRPRAALKGPDAINLAICERAGAKLLIFDRRQLVTARAVGIVCVDLSLAS